MGSYANEQRFNQYCEIHKDDFEYKLIDVKKIFNIPFLYVKQNNMNSKKYDLFNCIPLVEIQNYEGFKDV